MQVKVREIFCVEKIANYQMNFLHKSERVRKNAIEKAKINRPQMPCDKGTWHLR